jgi:hypothetical protein
MSLMNVILTIGDNVIVNRITEDLLSTNIRVIILLFYALL